MAQYPEVESSEEIIRDSVKGGGKALCSKSVYKLFMILLNLQCMIKVYNRFMPKGT